MERSSGYKYYSFDSENSILYHIVNNENFGSEVSFILSMSHFMTIMDDLKPRYIIIKVMKKPDFFERNLKSFMQVTFLRLVKDLDIKKVAFHIPEEFDPHHDLLAESNYDTSVKSRVFSKLEDAIQWVLSGNS